jgi:nicotinic acid phosphoribosyltransferase
LSPSTALYTDQYELTMLDAALHAGSSVQVIRRGEARHRPTLNEIRDYHRRAHGELPFGHPLPVTIRS